MIKVKTFIQALTLFSSSPEKSRRYLEDKRLTQAEKSILRGYFYLRDSKIEEVQVVLASINDISDPVIRSQLHLLSGIIHNNKNDFPSALKELNLSLQYLPKKELKYFKFVAHLNLFTVYFNLRNVSGMKREIRIMKSFEMTEIKEVVRFLSCEFSYFSFIHQFDEAQRILDELDGLRSQMSESDIVGHLLEAFDFYIKLKDVSKARDILKEMKSNRKFSLSENYRFLKKMLDHYTGHMPLYFQENEFRKQPVLLYHIKVIQQLEEGKVDEAAFWWGKLAEMYPDSFKKDFQYSGPVNIFSLCFELHQKVLQVGEIDTDDSKSKSKTVIEFLEKAQAPVSREVLFKFLWNRAAEDKEDFIRLSRKMYRIKKQNNLTIEYRKGCYLLVPAAKKKAS